MGSLERRIEALEAAYAGPAAGNTGERERLGINRKTVPGLIEQAAAEADPGVALEAAKSKAHYRQIIRTCWTKLSDKSLSVNSHNLPALIAQAANAQARLDRLNGVEAPQKVEVEEKMTLAEYARKVNGVPREQRLRVVD